MSTVFLATLGQRPEAITVALDLLLERHRYDRFALIHTNPQASEIAEAFKALHTVLRRDYPNLPVQCHEVLRADGKPLLDITDRLTAEEYFHGLRDVLVDYKRQEYHLHLLVAGGRKAMSIYGMLAASLVFNSNLDKVWTVISPREMVTERGQFHIPPGMRGDVHIVDLPIVRARVPQGADLDAVLERRSDRRADFLARLTDAQRRVVEALVSQPYATNEQISFTLGLSERTIENHLSLVYKVLDGFLDMGEQVANKRQALLDVLRN